MSLPSFGNLSDHTMYNTLLFLALLWIPCVLSGQPSTLLRSVSTASSTEQFSVINQLTKFPPAEFTASDRNTLETILSAETTFHRDRFFMLAGYLGMAEELRLIAPELRKTEKLKRSYGLAMVRAGDAFKRKQLLDKTKTLDYNDEFTYDIVPLLVYTHNREIYDYLIELTLQVNNGCEPPDPHVTGNIDCGYRMMEYLAPVLNDFPYSVGPSGDLEVENYRKALIEVREWLRRHRGDYEIVEGVY